MNLGQAVNSRQPLRYIPIHPSTCSVPGNRCEAAHQTRPALPAVYEERHSIGDRIASVNVVVRYLPFGPCHRDSLHPTAELLESRHPLDNTPEVNEPAIDVVYNLRDDLMR